MDQGYYKPTLWSLWRKPPVFQPGVSLQAFYAIADRSRLDEPFNFLESCLLTFLMVLRAWLKNWGDLILEPSEQVRNAFNPKSNSAILPVANLIPGYCASSTTTTINNSPNGVRLPARNLYPDYFKVNDLYFLIF